MADKVVTLYRRPTPTGAGYKQIAGLDLPASAGGAFSVPRSIVGPELVKPLEGDTVRDDEGGEWTVTAVGDLTEGAWPLTCEAAE